MYSKRTSLSSFLALPVMKFISVAQTHGNAFRMFVLPKCLSVSQHVSGFFPVIMVAIGQGPRATLPFTNDFILSVYLVKQKLARRRVSKSIPYWGGQVKGCRVNHTSEGEW